MKHFNLWIVFLLVIGSSILFACTRAPAAKEKTIPATVEKIEGSDFSRITLTEKAAQRLHIATTQVHEEAVNRTSYLSSEVVTFPDNEGTSSSNYWVRVLLSEGQQSIVDRSVPIHIKSVDDEEDNDVEEDEMIAEPDESREDDDAEENIVALYYRVKNASPNLSAGQRLLAEVPLVGSGGLRKVVPYAAVIYGVHGETWVYTNPEPLVFIRQLIVVDFIQGDLAVLSEGPELGTAVVTVGGEELFGAETGVSK